MVKYQKIIKRKIRDITIQTLVKYALTKRFYIDRRIQFYIYDFMHIDPDTIPEEE